MDDIRADQTGIVVAANIATYVLAIALILLYLLVVLLLLERTFQTLG